MRRLSGWALLLLTAWLAVWLVPAAPASPDWQPEKAAKAPDRPAVPNDALALASADLRTLDFDTRLCTRYVWVPDADPETAQCVALTVNYLSRGSVVTRPVLLGAGRLMLARLDARHYAPRDADMVEWLRTFEELRFDPAFNLLLTRDTLKFAAGLDIVVPKGKGKVVQKTQRREFKDQTNYPKDGKASYWDDVTKKYHAQPYLDEPYSVTVNEPDEDVVRVVGLHLDPALVAFLVDATHSQAPVVSAGYFLTRALTTIQDKGVAKTIYGGLYYQFAGIKRGAKKGTDEDVLLQDLGVGNVEKGITASKIFDDLRSDQRVAMFRSGVTGKPRRVDLLKTLAGRDSQGIISITHDLKAGDIDIATHPAMNLLDFQDAAREVIFEKPNGMHGFALFNGQGVLQDVVPPDVAIDGTVPFPNRAELQPAIGCIRCHAKESGWRVTTNDVKKLSRELDIFDDLQGGKKSQPDVIDRLAGLYAGDLELKVLPRARDDYNQTILQAGGVWKKSKDQTDVAKLSGGKIGDIFADYNFATVDARRVLRDLGYEVKDAKDAPALLKKLLPPVPLDAGGFVREDPRIGFLFAGGQLNRPDYDLVYGFMAARAAKARK